MEIIGKTELPFPREEIWQHLNDPDILRLSVPDCQSLEAESDSKLVATVVAKVGPIKATFNGEAVISDSVPPESYTLTANGKGGVAGFASAVIKVKLTDKGDSTELEYSVAANLGGKLAQLGTRLIESTARKWADKFFNQFSEVVAGGGQAPAASSSEPGFFARICAAIKGLFSSSKTAS
ncbi:carbon monoxide dehydrogenase subunit G [Maricurvus nonylphenolicus]|uniref:CoxG family protein n=1 Tax=Maricurvus nonylphenolicus TaxID=1008307 RepID=UPI0036F40DB3